MLKLASWNVNSLKIRLEYVLTWLNSSQTNLLALQETKLTNEHFPTELFLEQNYHVAFSGQKSYNGVAIISRQPLTEIVTDIPNLHDPQRRILAATLGDLRLINLYVPNGAAVNSDKYLYKLMWLEHVIAFVKQQLALYPKLAVVGDFNIAPENRDVHSPEEWQDCVLVSPKERQAFFDLLALGLSDSFRCFPQDNQAYSWWDYRANAFKRNRGLRIDHILLSKSLSDLCIQAQIDKTPRQWERPSDHAPVWAEIRMSSFSDPQ